MGRLSSFKDVLAGLPLKAYPAVRTRGVPHADASPSHALPARALGYSLELTPSEDRLFTIGAVIPVLIGEPIATHREIPAPIIDIERCQFPGRGFRVAPGNAWEGRMGCNDYL